MIFSYQRTDLAELMEVWRRSSSQAHPFLKQDFVDRVERDIKEEFLPNAETYVFKDNSALLGFISLIGSEIGGLFVDPTSQSKGIGTQLVDFAGERHQILEVEVFAKNKIGLAFYKKYGFIKMGAYFHKESSQAVLRLTTESLSI